ncbi:hypothetical protein FSP39_007431 [Pinctada imbricata]|uniref:Galactosylceramide sulfotransferase-like n=1 Tax=Pinctada imbricata TaxID=66713 RepID=A0AA88XUL8_PINIB|nr:hypothetical protein FSP39_007431 [Pinctada imbricata]
MYIGLVREPFSHFVSSFIYYTNVCKLPDLLKIPRNDTASSISWYLGNKAFIDKNHTREGKVDWTHMRNGMAYDFGFPINDIRNASRMKIDKFVKKLDVEFDLVIVLEHLDESLVLMRRMLRWSMKDILYILQSNKGVINSTDVKNSLTGRDRQRHREWEPVDIALYNHFLNKLLKQVYKQGASFQKELEDFKLTKHAAMQFCEDKKIKEELKWTIESTNEEITINSYDCTMLETIGLKFTPLIKQSKKYS